VGFVGYFDEWVTGWTSV